MDAPGQGDNDFWRFSLAVYAAPGVADECLALQDTLGVDVNLLLFCTWLGGVRRVAMTRAEIEDVRRAVASWHDQVVRPLRAARRQLKAFPGTDNEALRARVKSIELEAERLEQNMLFGYALERWPQTGGADARASVPANVEAFLQLHGTASAREALSTRQLIEAALRCSGQ